MIRNSEPHGTLYVVGTPIGNLDGNIKLAVEGKMLAQPLSEAQKKELVDIVYDPGK